MLVEGDGRDGSGDAVGEKRNRIKMDLDTVQWSSARVKSANHPMNQGAGASGMGQGNPSQIRHVQVYSSFLFVTRTDRHIATLLSILQLGNAPNCFSILPLLFRGDLNLLATILHLQNTASL